MKKEGRKDENGAFFQNWKWWPNTLKGHQLIYFAETYGNMDTNTCNSILFQAIYEEGENISLVDTLVKIGVEQMNLSDKEAQLRAFLEKDEGAPHVRSEIQKGRRRYDISGVPFFLIENQSSNSQQRRPYGLSGAQPTAAFLNVFDSLLEDEDE